MWLSSVCLASGNLGGQGAGCQEGKTKLPSRLVLAELPSSSLVSVLRPSFSQCVSVSAYASCHPAGCRTPVEKAKSHLEVPLEENVNRRVLEEGSIEARTIEDAIAVLR